MMKVYLAGEIHSNWREELIDLCKSANLDIQFFNLRFIKKSYGRNVSKIDSN